MSDSKHGVGVEGNNASVTNFVTGEWTCPVCGYSKSFFIPPNSNGSPVGHLRNHMQSSWDDEHNGYSDVPDIYHDEEALEKYIELQ